LQAKRREKSDDGNGDAVEGASSSIIRRGPGRDGACYLGVVECRAEEIEGEEAEVG